MNAHCLGWTPGATFTDAVMDISRHANSELSIFKKSISAKCSEPIIERSLLAISRIRDLMHGFTAYADQAATGAKDLYMAWMISKYGIPESFKTMNQSTRQLVEVFSSHAFQKLDAIVTKREHHGIIVPLMS
jgi:hypothetical protein